MLKLALAQPPFEGRTASALTWIERYIAGAANAGADIVCFPEAFVPGLRAEGFAVEDRDSAGLAEARARVCGMAKDHGIHVILPMEWEGAGGLLIAAFVISDSGEVLGVQAKTQIAPEEDATYAPGADRTLFQVQSVPFGIAICHEGWRYPETVRWAAARGAKIVFHPTHAGGADHGHVPESFGDPEAPYYEKAMMCRALENGIYFASINYALAYQEAATALISPEGRCLSRLPYGKPGLLIAEIDPDAATGIYAKRLAPERYPV